MDTHLQTWKASIARCMRVCRVGVSTRFAANLLVVLTTAVGLGSASCGKDLHCRECAEPVASLQDSIWLLSTRHVTDRCGVPCLSPPTYAHWENGGWRPGSAAAFQADGGCHTVVFVHGNRIESHEAPQLGLDLHRRLHSACPGLPPCRFVIWSWPSDRIPGPLRDARVKAEVALGEAFLLGHFWQGLPADRPISIVAFSYGAQVVLGASHLVAGGILDRHGLPDEPGPRVRPAIVLAAAAVDTNWLCPGRILGHSLDSISHLTLITNRRDPVLKHYHIATGQRHTVALGVAGLTHNPAMPHVQCDFGDVLGRSHSWERHLESNAIVRLMVPTQTHVAAVPLVLPPSSHTK